MKHTKYITLIAIAMTAGGILLSSCSGGKHSEDRASADSLFKAVASLTGEYTVKITAARDSADWAKITKEFEDSLTKINFNLPPDTDLQLTEGQNDTIYQLTEAYIAARDARLNAIMHPKAPIDSVPGEEL